MYSSRWIKLVIAFDETFETIFEEKRPIPNGKEPEVVIIDRSGSMHMFSDQASTALGELTKGTNAENKIGPIMTAGRTGMISCIDAIKDDLSGCRVYLIGDGVENCYKGPLTMSDGSVTTLDDRDYHTDDYQRTVADWLVNTCGIQFIMVALGTDSAKLVKYLLNRDKACVCSIPRGTPSKSVIGTVRATTERANRIRTARATGQPAPQPQSEALMPVSPEAAEMIRNIPETEVEHVAETVRNVRFTAAPAVKPKPPPTAEEITKEFFTAEANVVNQLSLTTDEIKFARAVILAYMGFCLEINDGKGLPATFISGLRTHSRVALYDAPQKLAPYFNKMLAALSKTKALRAAGKVPDGGLKLESNGLKFSFAKDTSMYTTDATKDVIEALKSDGEFALAESQLKKRAAPAASPGRAVRQRTDAGEPQAAPAAAAMDEAAEA